MSERRLALDDGSLVDVLDRLLDAGAYLDGTVLLTLADVDLVRLDLRLLLASVHTLRPVNSPQQGQLGADQPVPQPRQVAAEHPAEAALESAVPPRESTMSPDGAPPPESTMPPPERAAFPGPATDVDGDTAVVRTANELCGDVSKDRKDSRVQEDSNDREDGDDRQAGIAGLVVVLVDLVRQLLERQALRRMDAGTLTDAEVERLGRALMALEQQTAELTAFVDRRRRHPPHHPPPIGSARDLDLGLPLTDTGRRAHP
jgi:hypothetical protein